MADPGRKVCEGEWKKKRWVVFYEFVYLNSKGYLNIDEDKYWGGGVVKLN